MIALDTSVVVALLNATDAHHAPVVDWVRTTDRELVTTPLAVAEMGHLVTKLGGAEGAAALRDELASGAYAVEWWPEALRETLAIADRHSALSLGLTDASLVALSARLGTAEIATLDQRHFRAVAPLGDDPAFRLLPLDA